MSFNNELIGSGTYGKVYRTEEYVEKHMKINTTGVFNELYFYKKYKSGKFFPKLLDAYLKHNDKTTVILKLSYEGNTLASSVLTFDFGKRVSMLPELISQFGRILRWLSRNMIIHYDIKPANVCIKFTTANTFVIKLIDFNFTIPIVRKNFLHVGTHVFADPSYHKRKNHTTQYDVFSSGMTLFYWLLKKYASETSIKDGTFLNSEFDIASLKKLIPDHLINVLIKMVDINEKTRIKQSDIPDFVNPKIQITLKESNHNIYYEHIIYNCIININELPDSCDHQAIFNYFMTKELENAPSSPKGDGASP